MFHKISKAKTQNRSVSSARWINRHAKDPYIVSRDIDGYRSRSAYKLIEIDKKFRILRPKLNILELGSAPGGWSQVISRKLKSQHSCSNVLSLDILKMMPVDNIVFVQADFLSVDIRDLFFQKFSSYKLDLILSDIAPNFSGNKDADHYRMMSFFEQLLYLTITLLSVGANFVAKIFHSSLDQKTKNLLLEHFSSLRYFKPKSSRKESEEIYLIALNKRS